MYAVIVSGGKQYRVTKGDTIYVEKLEQATGDAISFDVLLLGSDEGVKVGNPTVAGAKVEGTVLGQVKGEKIIIYKYKSKKNFDRKTGHRQNYTKVEITAVG